MFLIIRNAQEIVDNVKLINALQEQTINLVDDLERVTNKVTELKGRIAGLELENESLQREVDHWRLKAQFNKDKKVANA